MTSSRARLVISVLAILGTLPYITLKIAWLSGSRVGLRDPDFGDGAEMYVANALTLALDSVAILMALSFVTAWGRRLPAWLVLTPMWVGTGLLAPILVVVPLQLLVGDISAEEAAAEQPIADWVFTMVYAGFMWQGLFLLTGFVLYAVARWGGALGWREPLRTWPGRSAWATAPLPVLMLAATGLVLHRPDGSPIAAVNLAGDLAMIAVTAVGLLMLAWRWPGSAPRWVAVVLTWLGSGALAAWGLYTLVLLAVPNDLVGDRFVAPTELLAQGVRICGGLVAAAVGLRLLVRRVGQQSGGGPSVRSSDRSRYTLSPQPDQTSR